MEQNLGSTVRPAVCTELPVITVRMNVVTTFTPSFLPLSFFSLTEFRENLPEWGTTSSQSYGEFEGLFVFIQWWEQVDKGIKGLHLGA